MPAPAPLTARLGDLEPAVRDRLSKLDADHVVERIWDGDHTVWRDDPAEIADRLGWLAAPQHARGQLDELRAFAGQAADEGLTHAVLLGMGGSSLAPEVYRRGFGVADGMLDVRVLDTTHPDAIASLEREVPLDRTLFVVSSKSGTTIETRSQLAYFHDRVGDGSRFVVVTDPGTPLEDEARRLGFRRVFAAPPDVGGRYSALTVFGLLPAALIGADLDGLLDEAERAAGTCRVSDAAGNPGAFLGVAMAEAALRGRDKLMFFDERHFPMERGRPADLQPLGSWLEQLVAESTGKEGKGIVPVVDEGQRPAAEYGADRFFVTLGNEYQAEPSVTLPYWTAADLGAAFFLLEFAVAVAGHVLGIHPFDQPDVQAAKDRTADVLSSGDIPEELAGDVDALLETVRPGDYVAIQAFVAPSGETWSRLQDARGRIAERLGVATTLGYGPRYLHSTGQLHKGGPDTGVFVQLLQEPIEDRAIPGAPYSFGRLIAAQATGDLRALRDAGRRAARIGLDDLMAWGR